MTHTGFVDSRLNTDKNILITQILVFPSVRNSGCITSSLLSRMCGIQDVAPILVFPENKNKHHYYFHRKESDYYSIPQIPTETKERLLLRNMLMILLSLTLIMLVISKNKIKKTH